MMKVHVKLSEWLIKQTKAGRWNSAWTVRQARQRMRSQKLIYRVSPQSPFRETQVMETCLKNAILLSLMDSTEQGIFLGEPVRHQWDWGWISWRPLNGFFISCSHVTDHRSALGRSAWEERLWLADWLTRVIYRPHCFMVVSQCESFQFPPCSCIYLLSAFDKWCCHCCALKQPWIPEDSAAGKQLQQGKQQYDNSPTGMVTSKRSVRVSDCSIYTVQIFFFIQDSFVRNTLHHILPFFEHT